MNLKLRYSRQKFLFLLIVTAVYSGLLVWRNFLQGPPLWDESHFWETSLTFSDHLIPTISQLRSYNELNTPLPFVIFGILEHLFHQGIFAGRALNLMLSLVMVFIIGWPRRNHDGRSILCFMGLLMCPYYLWYCGLLYTDIIACFWVLLGFVCYVQHRHLLSCVAFVLAIASRQYMLAFPLSITLYEVVFTFRQIHWSQLKSLRSFRWSDQWRWVAPFIAALSILGWFYLFQGLIPQPPQPQEAIVTHRATLVALVARSIPLVQQTVWAVTPGGAINFFASVAVYIVIPEAILFHALKRRQRLGQYIKRQRLKIILITISLCLYIAVFPPLPSALGLLVKIANLLPTESLRIVLFYSLSLLTCLRFSKFSLISLSVLLNSLIMMKAYPWDKYILPLVIVFWYLKSVGFPESPQPFIDPAAGP